MGYHRHSAVSPKQHSTGIDTLASMAGGISWAVVIGAVLGCMLGGVYETVAGGVVIGCGIVAATVWWYVAERRWRDRAQLAGSFAIAGGAFSVANALGKPSVWVGAIFGLFTVLFCVIVWFTADGPGSDLGGPTD